MKKFLPFLVAIVVVATMVVLSAEAYAAKPMWILYDDFNSGGINPELWTIDNSSANISIEAGRAKFYHLPFHPNDSAWLGIKIAPEKVRGIKVKVTVESCTGDVRARIGGYIGKVENSYVFDELGLEGSIASPRIFGILSLVGPSGPFFTQFYAQYMTPLEVIGNTFTITMIFSPEKVTYEVSGLGEIEHRFPENLSPTDFYFKGIGTRSNSGNGWCVVYYDDVYILQ